MAVRTNFLHTYTSAFPECSEEHPCEGLGEHAHYRNFGMAFLTLFRVATGDNWNGIMKVNNSILFAL